MNNKHYYNWQDIERMCVSIVSQMAKDQWIPDYIVGITRGGNIPATIISQMLDVRCETLKVKLRDNKENESCESNCWMSEDAFGYVDEEIRRTIKSRWDINSRKNILIVDDINDSGETFKWIVNDWQSSCLPGETSAWKSVWNHNVRFAALTNNEASSFDLVRYTAHSINKVETPQWLVYPWESVGTYNDS